MKVPDSLRPAWNTLKSFRGGPGEYRGELLRDKIVFLVAVGAVMFAILGLTVCAVALARIVGGV